MSSAWRRGWAALQRYDGPLTAGTLVLVLLAGVGYALILGNQLRFLPDESDYAALSENLVVYGRYSLDGITPSAYRPPGYAWFLAPIRFLGGGVMGYRIANYLALAAALFLLHGSLRKQSIALPWLGILLAAGFPLFFFTAGTLYPQTLASALWLAVIFLVSGERMGFLKALLAGVFAGWLVLTVPTFILSVGVLAVWLVWVKNGRAGAVLSVTALLMVSAWGLRNLAVFDRPVFISTNSGENLLLGNSENTTPNGGRTVDISRYEQAAAAMDEVSRDAYYRSQALDYMRAHPVETLRMYALKTANYFNYRNDLVTASQSSQWRDLILMVTYAPLLLVFAARLALGFRYPLSRMEVLLAVLYLSSAFISAIFFTRIRFRLPYDFLLVMVDALFLNRLLQAAAGRQPMPYDDAGPNRPRS